MTKVDNSKCSRSFAIGTFVFVLAGVRRAIILHIIPLENLPHQRNVRDNRGRDVWRSGHAQLPQDVQLDRLDPYLFPGLQQRARRRTVDQWPCSSIVRIGSVRKRFWTWNTADDVALFSSVPSTCPPSIVFVRYDSGSTDPLRLFQARSTLPRCRRHQTGRRPTEVRTSRMSTVWRKSTDPSCSDDTQIRGTIEITSRSQMHENQKNFLQID